MSSEQAGTRAERKMPYDRLSEWLQVWALHSDLSYEARIDFSIMAERALDLEQALAAAREREETKANRDLSNAYDLITKVMGDRTPYLFAYHLVSAIVAALEEQETSDEQ